MKRFITFLAALLIGGWACAASDANAPAQKTGIVIMHGKGGSPMKHVADLASALEAKGYLVANLEMPWSGRRDYDVSVSVAEQEVEAALDSLRSKGANRFFVAGHSQGGLFTLYFARQHRVDGIIAIAPGGNVSNSVFREKVGPSVELAQKLIAEGKGNEKTSLSDYEGSRGSYPLVSTPAAYLGWFDPEGAMNQTAAMKNVNPQIPVLYIGPKGDYPGLLKVRQAMFDALPANPLSKLYEPDTNHLGAPSASVDEIVRWTAEVISKTSPVR
ncbi:carboxylesterase [Herminiimonas sp.]|uniref:alpha/beta hydrolase n=1 Tax=Herminiimonas sp. TaxID=1926289 RepID=UPI00271C6E46|nr:alpha/beta hydrolase [Herminiimonas sp.]MDO8305589.1 alpha/beta hydrolase [Herminiimonas sp.]